MKTPHLASSLVRTGQGPSTRGGELPISEIGLRTSPEIFVFAPTENICRVTTAAALRRRKRRDAARCKGECHLGTGAGDNWLHPAPGPGVRRSPYHPWLHLVPASGHTVVIFPPHHCRIPPTLYTQQVHCLYPLTASPGTRGGQDTAARSLSCHQCLQCLHVTSPHTLPVVSTASME